MPQSKYYKTVEQRLAKYGGPRSEALPPFDLQQIAAKSWFQAQKSKATQALLKPIYRFGRGFMPVMNLAGITHIVRDSEVRQVLARPQDFPVPFGPEMKALAGGATFVLGLEGEEHTRQNALIHKIVRPSDAERIVKLARKFSEALIENSAGRIDAVNDYFKRVAAEICVHYFGFSVQDSDAFADWTIATSALLFADPYGDENTADLAFNGAARLRAVIDNSVSRLKRLMEKGALAEDGGDTLLERLLTLQLSGEEQITDAEIRAILYGLVAGFIPTNTLAAAKMLEELVRRPDAYKSATEAAAKGERETLKKILLEASRLNPGLAPGQFRYCPRDTHIEVDGKQKKIKAGSLLMVSTMSAMRDKRAFAKPQKFWPERTGEDGEWAEPDLVFGAGIHVCIGKHLAIEQITETAMLLLAQKSVRPAPGKAGRMRLLGPAPRHMEFVYETPAAKQSMFIVLADVEDGISKEQADGVIARLGNPAGSGIRAAMNATGIVHFTSLSTIQTEKALKLAFELSVDGEIDDALALIAQHAGEYLRPAFALAGLAENDDLAQFMSRHVVTLHAKMWGATGRNYNGLTEFPVAKVEKQARFADFAGRVLRDYVATETARGSHPTLVLGHLRRILRQDSVLKREATPAQLALMQEADHEGFDAFQLVTQKMRLKLTAYRERSHWQRALDFLKTRDAFVFYNPFFLLFALSCFLFWPAIGGSLLPKILIVAMLAFLSATALGALIIGIFLALVRFHEERDSVYEDDPPLAKLRAIIAAENPPGYEQNHVMAVGKLKPGLFRKMVHAFSLWSIGMSVKHWFRPGLINHMGTIHYARWWRIPGTETVSFYSNFDGSWENYLEDFIMRNRWGQSVGWSNWQGFPKTRFLMLGGAGDADGFKRWVRIVQQIAPFWYSRFPDLATERIRNNGMIHIGTGLAESATEAEEWIRCFSSMPRLENRIEHDEVQALVFRGMKRLPYSACLALQLPPAGSDLGEYLCWIRGKPMRGENFVPHRNHDAIKLLIEEGILVPVPRPEGQQKEYALAHALTVTFGDRPLDGGHSAGLNEASPANLRDAQSSMAQAAIFGLSAAGIGKFDAPHMGEEELAECFPDNFRMGMAARGRALGDIAENAPENWRWNDDPREADATEAVLMLYASDRQSLARMEQAHSALLENHGGRLLTKIDCAPAWPDKQRADFEHFGYRDGISQPAIKGSSRATKMVPERDVIEPGEFILGYGDSMGYYPASPLLPEEADMAGALPVVIGENLSKYPDFGNRNLADAPRDLGRNGSFLVIRQLKQDVEGFDKFVGDAAASLNKGGFGDLYKVVGQSPDKEWVKAKLMGRWTNGRPLVGNPVFKQSSPESLAAETENDFSFGEDDPHGLACPFGSHIRRTNPRDSKLPGDEGALEISNRHRILRRGRPYSDAKTGEKGLLFACFCTDIERQFEFVQQFWSNAPSFHGLKDEPDPIIGACPIDPATGESRDRLFTIPTASGPVRIEGLKNFVQMMGGGYFFVPSRSALSWLSDTALYAPVRRASTGKQDVST